MMKPISGTKCCENPSSHGLIDKYRYKKNHVLGARVWDTKASDHTTLTSAPSRQGPPGRPPEGRRRLLAPQGRPEMVWMSAYTKIASPVPNCALDFAIDNRIICTRRGHSCRARWSAGHVATVSTRRRNARFYRTIIRCLAREGAAPGHQI